MKAVTLELLNVEQVGKMIGVSGQTVRRMTQDGQIGYIDIRGCRKIKKSEVLDWIEKNYVKAGGSRRHTGEVGPGGSSDDLLHVQQGTRMSGPRDGSGEREVS